MNNKYIKPVILIATLIILVVAYSFYNPLESELFPKCMFFVATGYKCPGCGAQRLVHYLLNFEIFEALKSNALLFISLPYILLVVYIEYFVNDDSKYQRYRAKFMGSKTILLLLIIVVLFTLFRNIFNF